jgi:hypothetical protein
MESYRETYEHPYNERENNFSIIRSKKYATVSVSISPKELPVSFLKKILAICASKIGSGDVDLASHLLITLNVSFHKRAGRIASDVLIIKNPDVYRLCAGESGVSAR